MLVKSITFSLILCPLFAKLINSTLTQDDNKSLSSAPHKPKPNPQPAQSWVNFLLYTIYYLHTIPVEHRNITRLFYFWSVFFLYQFHSSPFFERLFVFAHIYTYLVGNDHGLPKVLCRDRFGVHYHPILSALHALCLVAPVRAPCVMRYCITPEYQTTGPSRLLHGCSVEFDDESSSPGKRSSHALFLISLQTQFGSSSPWKIMTLTNHDHQNLPNTSTWQTSYAGWKIC